MVSFRRGSAGSRISDFQEVEKNMYNIVCALFLKRARGHCREFLHILTNIWIYLLQCRSSIAFCLHDCID